MVIEQSVFVSHETVEEYLLVLPDSDQDQLPPAVWLRRAHEANGLVGLLAGDGYRRAIVAATSAIDLR
jgi:hypothetical protein